MARASRLHFGLVITTSALLIGQTRALGAQDTAAVPLATKAAESWLALVDQGKLDESWAQASERFRAAVTADGWRAAVSQARGPFEPFGTRTLLGAQYTDALPNAPPGEYVIIQYRTSVSGDRQVVETVVPMRDSDGQWRVSGYFIRPQ